MSRGTKLIVAAAASAGWALGVRPRMLDWGATPEEVAGPFPGAEIIPGGRRGGTMATTIDAPPAAVWPWLVQMGCDRAGWYSWDRLDNGGRRSAERIHPEWQSIAVGDRLLSRPDGSTWFDVAAIEPGRFLALRASLDIRGRPFDPRGTRPAGAYSDSTWCFLLREIGDERTRLLVSGWADSRPALPARVMDALLWEPAHWLMQTRQFVGLKRRAARRPA